MIFQITAMIIGFGAKDPEFRLGEFTTLLSGAASKSLDVIERTAMRSGGFAGNEMKGEAVCVESYKISLTTGTCRWVGLAIGLHAPADVAEGSFPTQMFEQR